MKNFFENCEKEEMIEAVDASKMWKSWEKNSALNPKEWESQDTTFHYGDLPQLPVVELFEENAESVLFVTRAQKELLDSMGEDPVLFELPSGYFNGTGGGEIHLSEMDEVFVVEQ